MGYMQHKYTLSYFLKRDDSGKQTEYGVAGLEEFLAGGIRICDKDILERLSFAGANVLDIGYGRGESIKYALEHGANKVVGVDFSDEAYRIALRMLTSFNLNAELSSDDALEFIKKYTSKESFDFFDIVIMFDVVEHIPRTELSEILKILHKCLKQKSVIAINTPVFNADNDVINQGLLDDARDTSDNFVETQGMHCNRYTKESLKEFMGSCGFDAVSGHLFIFPGDDNKINLKQAIKNGYPIFPLALKRPEMFEYSTISKDSQNSKFISIIRKSYILLFKVIKYYLKPFKILYQKLMKIDDKKRIPDLRWITVKGGTLQGYQFKLDMNPSIPWIIDMALGTYDQFIYSILSSFENLEGKVFWDIGAHIGYHTLSFAVLAGEKGKVVSFEPNPYNLIRLHDNINKNVGIYDRITVIDKAVSDINGETIFHFSDNVDEGESSGSYINNAIVPLDKSAYKLFTKTNISTVCADTLIADNSVPAPDIIKIDVEGAEMMVLKGCHNLLLNKKPLLFIEVHGIVLMYQLQKLLLFYNYEIEIIEDAPGSASRCFVFAYPKAQLNESQVLGA